jgi:hypothetical protein
LTRPSRGVRDALRQPERRELVDHLAHGLWGHAGDLGHREIVEPVAAGQSQHERLARTQARMTRLLERLQHLGEDAFAGAGQQHDEVRRGGHGNEPSRALLTSRRNPLGFY